MIEEYDVVEAIRDLNDKVLKGCRGTALIKHRSIPPAFEVEFIDRFLETLDILTVELADITKV